MEKETIVLNKLEDTLALGKRIADGLKPGDVIALTGPLGAGKTALTQAIAKGLGVTERLASPTFTVLMEFEEYLGGDWVCVIEWADLIEDILPPDTKWIALSYGDLDDERICEIEW